MSHIKAKGILYLIPTYLGESDYNTIFPELNKKIILSIKNFIVEDIRAARRFLKNLNYPGDFHDVQFFILNEHTFEEDTINYLDSILNGKDIGLLSDAGMPCIADPGNTIVQKAHQKDIIIKVLVGPSSIFLALAASGFNGQEFSFHGYLPIKDPEKTKKIKELEKLARQHNQTQIFIEAPYRNLKLFDSIIKSCNPDTKLCIASSLTLSDEYVKTKEISEWKKHTPPIQKKPTVFILGY